MSRALRRHPSRKIRRKLFRFSTLFCAIALGLVLYASHAIRKQSSSSVYETSSDLPHRRVGLVLGCSPRLGGGNPNWYFNNRIEAAAEVLKAGKVDYLLLSGDNHTADYDEPTAMMEALVQRGVPMERMVLDYAGFSTSDSVVRAKEVFGLRDVCIVTQKDHAMRAIYIARHKGIDAIAFAAKDIPTMAGARTRARESLARVRTLLDVHVWGRRPHFGGPRIEIGKDSEEPPKPSSGEDDVGV